MRATGLGCRCCGQRIGEVLGTLTCVAVGLEVRGAVGVLAIDSINMGSPKLACWAFGYLRMGGLLMKWGVALRLLARA